MQFTEAERAVYYPEDRRFRIWIRPVVLAGRARVGSPNLCLVTGSILGTTLHCAESRLRFGRCERSARISCLDSVVPLLQSVFYVHVDPQRNINFDGPSAPLL